MSSPLARGRSSNRPRVTSVVIRWMPSLAAPSSVTEDGAAKLGIHLITTLVTRGLLLDLPRAKGLDILEPGYPITPDDLDAACAFGGVTVESGDVVLVRTGQTLHLALPGRPGLGGAAPEPGAAGKGQMK